MRGKSLEMMINEDEARESKKTTRISENEMMLSNCQANKIRRLSATDSSQTAKNSFSSPL